MSEADPRYNSTAAGETPVVPKRRKVRKGTQSCWECKRRKIRCTFASSTETICDGCRSRRIKCIGQDFHHETAIGSGKVDRLSRMESLVEKLVNRSSVNLLDKLQRDQSNQDEVTHSLTQNSGENERGIDFERLPYPPTTVSHLGLESNGTGNLDQLSRVLLAAWPDQHDLNLILSVPVDVLALFHGVVCMPYSRFLTRKLSSPRHMLQLPSPGSHPVLVARRLLLLGALLQGIPPRSVKQLDGMKLDYRAIMSRVVRTSSRLVTSDDELVSSLDGIECVMIESMYLNNAGNLRRAWSTNRRAMVMAQMMGLHRGSSSPSLSLEPETRDRIDPDYMWFRIVATDRYLSLMLGLPQGSLENVFASPRVLQNCGAVERMERMESIAAGIVLQRNSAERNDLAATQKVDKMLQEAAALMPPQWWLMTPDSMVIAGNDAKAFEESIRFTNQLAHHHLLVQLHLPYMMQSSSANSSYDYSKMTAANASRTIIAQFVAFRESNLATAYCRGIDFAVFIASTTLCLVHIEARREYKADPSKGVTIFQSLQHQRMNDRGLLERTLEIMEMMAQRSHDAVAQKISLILRPLLTIENNSATGTCYHTSASELDKQESQWLSDKGENVYELRIYIPYLGTIKIKHDPTLSDTVEPAQTHAEEWLRDSSISQATDTGLVVLCEPVSPLNQGQNQPQHAEVTSAASPLGYEITAAHPVNHDWQAVPSYLDPPDSLQQFEPANWDQSFSSADTNGAQTDHLLVPGLAADTDDWALQGVDLALFSSLT